MICKKCGFIFEKEDNIRCPSCGLLLNDDIVVESPYERAPIIPKKNQEDTIDDIEYNFESIDNVNTKTNYFKIPIIILSIVLLFCLILFGGLFIKNQLFNNKKNESSIKVSSNNRVILSGYSILIPEGYYYQQNSNSIIISDNNDFTFNLMIADVNYSKIIMNYDIIKKSYQDKQFNILKMEEVKQPNKNYLVYSLEKNNNQLNINITSTGNNQVFVVIAKQGNDLKKIDNILKDIILVNDNLTNSKTSDYYDFSSL